MMLHFVVLSLICLPMFTAVDIDISSFPQCAAYAIEYGFPLHCQLGSTQNTTSTALCLCTNRPMLDAFAYKIEENCTCDAKQEAAVDFVTLCKDLGTPATISEQDLLTGGFGGDDYRCNPGVNASITIKIAESTMKHASLVAATAIATLYYSGTIVSGSGGYNAFSTTTQDTTATGAGIDSTTATTTAGAGVGYKSTSSSSGETSHTVVIAVPVGAAVVVAVAGATWIAKRRRR